MDHHIITDKTTDKTEGAKRQTTHTTILLMMAIGEDDDDDNIMTMNIDKGRKTTSGQ